MTIPSQSVFRTSRIGGALILVLSVLLEACGGGGGGGVPAPPPQQAQSIAFAQPGTRYEVLGHAAYANPASGGAGSGDITYSSDTPSVAAVDANTGEVTIVGAGGAMIKASKAADSGYLSAQASYQLLVAPASVSITAWIGPNDTQVQLGALPFAMEIAHASDLNCDPSNVASCLNGAQTSTDTMAVLDTSTTLTQPSMYWLKHGANTTLGIALPEQKFFNNTVGGTVEFNGRLWVVTAGYQPSNEAWSSADGLNWRREATNIVGVAQTDVHLLVNNNALWVIVGNTSNCEVWRSDDGKSWTKVSANPGFPGRIYMATASFNGRLWVMGGINSGVGLPLNDLWSSSDGVTWVQNSSQVFPTYGRSQMEMMAFKGRLWVFGGYLSGLAYADVWSSADGAVWQQETAAAEFGTRYAERVVTDGSQLWLIGGQNGYQSAQTDVWNSADGKAWSLVTASAEWGNSSTINLGAAWWNGAFWVINTIASEVWRSPTAVHWTKIGSSARVPGIGAQTMAAFQNHLWAIGYNQEVWSSSDGLNWTQDSNLAPGSISYPQLVALPDKLMLIAGWTYSAPNYNREVWQSSDGHVWTKVSSSVPVSAENQIQTLVFNGKLWMFGTNFTDGVTPEIWSSPDGTNWTLVASNPAFAPRVGYQAIAYAGKLFVVAGSNGQVAFSDVWSSNDGVAWTVLSTPSGLTAANYATSIALSNTMCVYGGTGNDAWCSADGNTWNKLNGNTPIGPVAVLGDTAYSVSATYQMFDSMDLVWKSTDGGLWRLGYQNTLTFP